jgi:hypothetical protein
MKMYFLCDPSILNFVPDDKPKPRFNFTIGDDVIEQGPRFREWIETNTVTIKAKE